MAAGDVYRLTSSAVGLGMTVMNVLSIRTIPATDPTQSDWQALADAWKEVHRPIQSAHFAYNTWRAVQVFGDGVTYGPEDCKRHGGRLYTGTHTGTVVGGITTADEVLPPQNAGVITLSSPFIGRRKRGRLYIWGFTESVQTSGQWSAARLTAWNTAFTSFHNIYKSSGTSPLFQYGIWSERTATGCVWDPVTKDHIKVDTGFPDQAFEPVASFQIRSIVYNQRRRTLGVGR